MLYNPDGQTRIVDGPDEHDRLARQGWQQNPLPVHQRPQVSHSPVMSGGDPMGLLVRSVIEAVLDERGFTREFAAKLAAASPPSSSEPTETEPPPFLPSKRK